MYLKKYRKATVREALRAVREELGSDALVLSTIVSSIGAMASARGAYGASVKSEASRRAQRAAANRSPATGR